MGISRLLWKSHLKLHTRIFLRLELIWWEGKKKKESCLNVFEMMKQQDKYPQNAKISPVQTIIEKYLTIPLRLV